VTAVFAALRAKYRQGADDAYAAARKAFGQRNQEGGHGKYQEIVDQYYASPRYRSVKRWMAERK
jgi:hypothetical protein